jgi:uncharacterized protein YwqG
MTPGPDAPLLARLAHAYLEPDVAERWLRLTKPAIQLTTAHGGGDVVAVIGGRPRVPPDFGWPVSESRGPLSFVAEVDLAALAASPYDPGIVLPTEGRLLAFCSDDEDALHARLLHVPGVDTSCRELAAPHGATEFARKALAARPMMTFPNSEHPALEREFGTPGQDDDEWLAHPVNADDFTEALNESHDAEPLHQVGGWAQPVQGPVELEVASGDGDALRWHLVLQIGSDADLDMSWGDLGTLYWLAPAQPGRSPSLELGSFTWQC